MLGHHRSSLHVMYYFGAVSCQPLHETLKLETMDSAHVGFFFTISSFAMQTRMQQAANT